MRRDRGTPFLLWVIAALFVHAMSGGGAYEVARRLGARQAPTGGPEPARPPIEVSLVTTEEAEPRPTPEPAPDAARDAETPAPPESEPETTPETATPPEPTPATPPPPKPPSTEPPPPLPPAPPEDRKLQELTPRQREKIAVNQPVEDKNQADPENADHIAEHANKVDEETRAKITALDSERNDFEEGTGQRMAEAEPGNSTETRVAQSEESPGETKRAPNEGAVGRHDGADTPAAKADLGKPNESARSWNDQGKGTSTEKSAESRPAEAARAAERADAGAPETAWSEDGAFSVEKSRAAKEAKAGKKKRLPPPQRKGKPGDLLGLGSGSTTANGVNLNLGFENALDPKGRDALAEANRADGERRLSEHRGSFSGLGLKRWKAAIENYVGHVKVGNQTRLNTAKSPFATYLWRMHTRIHPIFADTFLPTLERFPQTDPINDLSRYVTVELVLHADSGRIVDIGIIKTSGITLFDLNALEALWAAAPFGKPPEQIVSPDRRVYLHWEFHREPGLACSDRGAHPYLLGPTDAPPGAPGAPPLGPRREPAAPPAEQHGEAAPEDEQSPADGEPSTPDEHAQRDAAPRPADESS